MDEARWQQVQDLFHEAAGLEASGRMRFLQQACGNDTDLAGEVQAMLAAEQAAEDPATPSILDRGLEDIAMHLFETPGPVESQEFGPYRLKHVLGEGGMGVVWLAERTDAGNLVAIKFLPHAGLSPSRQDRFSQEIRTLARLQHPYIARLYDAGTLADRTPWFVMEYVDGATLSQYSRDPGHTIVARLRLFRQICEAVQHAHSQEIIHRDLKPSNIMVASDGTPRLLDFGISRQMQQLQALGDLTQPGLRFYSANYSAPEWINGGAAGFTIDVYSLGVILFELLTGQLPFADQTHTATTPIPKASQRGRGYAHPRIAASAWSDLDTLCLTALRYNPAERYRSVEALLRDIDHYLQQEPLEARPYSLPYRANLYIRRHRTAVLCISATLLLIFGMAVFFTLRLTISRNAALAEAARARRMQQFMLTLIGASQQKAAPADNLRVLTLLDHGTEEAAYLSSDPEAQSDLYQNLGTMYDMLGEYTKAQQLLQHALTLRQTASPNPARAAELLSQLGLAQADQAQNARQFERAEGSARQAVTLLSGLPPADPRVLAARSALGRILAEAGESQQAIALLTPILSMPAGTPSGYTLSDTLSTLAGADYDTGNIAQAEAVTARSLALDRQLYGPNHPQFAVDLVNAGLNKAAVSHFAQAEPLYRQAIRIEQAWYGPNHPDLADYQGLLARTLHEQGKLDESVRLLQSALKIQRRAYNGDTEHSAVTLDTLGEIELDRNRLPEAEQDFFQAVHVLQTTVGAGNYQTAIVAADLGETLRRESQYDRARPTLTTAVQTLEATLPAGAFNTAIAQLSLGRTLLALHQFEEAELQLSQALAVYEKQDHPTPADLAQIHHDLAMAQAGRPQTRQMQ